MKRIQPSVVIGLGGTGVNTVTFLKKTLLEQAPDIARFVRFLAIDIDELKGEVPSGRLFGENIRLNPDQNEFFHITDQTTGAEAQNIPAVSSWFPPEGYKYLPLTEGALNMFRRLVGNEHAEIARILNNAGHILFT